MSAAEIAQLLIILAPIAKDIAVEGGKIITTYRSDVSQDQINQSLELSRSANWAELKFGQES